MNALGLRLNIGSRRSAKKVVEVRLCEPAMRSAATEMERFVQRQLSGQTFVAYDQLVSRVAEWLYRKELELGASVLDIGLFGHSLFIAEARRELDLRRGKLWDIEEAESSDELVANRYPSGGQVASSASRSHGC